MPTALIGRSFLIILPASRWSGREDGPLLQFARLALIVAALSRCGGPRGQVAGAQRFPRCLPSDGRELRRARVQRILRTALAKIGGQPVPGALRAPFDWADAQVLISRCCACWTRRRPEIRARKRRT